MKKEAFLQTINGLLSDHLCGLNPLKKRGYYFFCLKKTIIRPLKEQEIANSSGYITFKSDQNDLIKVIEPEEPKKKRFHTKQIK
jgi:hypothetical protein